MDFYTSANSKEEIKDKIKSGIITAVVWFGILLFVFLYTVKINIPKEQEIVSTMLINFGDNRNGNGIEEPAEQEGSLSGQTSLVETPSEAAQPQTESKEEFKETPKEKILTGNNPKMKVPVKKTETSKNTSKSTSKKSEANKKNSANNISKTSSGKATTVNAKKGNGDGKGTAAIGNLIKGRGNKAGSQGTGSGVGNYGDPLGGDSNGNSRIGVDRKLVSFIPGTMGRGGAQPSHSCSVSGSITIAYTVDKAGNVVSARRSGGSSDACIVNTSISWVKKYVKAEKANFSSTGTYKISF